jgi:hypothetical protein
MNGLSGGMAGIINGFRPKVITEMPVSLDAIAKEGRKLLFEKELRKADGKFHPSKLCSPCLKADVIERIILKLIEEDSKEKHAGAVLDNPTLRAAYDVYGGPEEVLVAIRNESFDYKSYRSMDAGTAIHEMEQQKYFGPSGKVLGFWKCSNCKTVVEEISHMPESPCQNEVSVRSKTKDFASEIIRPCAKFGTWLYEEARGIDTEFDVSWKVDLIVEVPEGRIIVDDKTMNSERWGALEEPQPKDATQLQIYLWLLGAEHGILRYINAGDHQKDPKHFYLARDTKVERWVKNYIKTVRELVASNRWEDIGGVCDKPTQVRAKRCPFSFLCFK